MKIDGYMSGAKAISIELFICSNDSQTRGKDVCLQEHVRNSCFCIVAYNNNHDRMDLNILSEKKCFSVLVLKTYRGM